MSTLDDYLQLLANEQRRRLLRALLGSDGSATVDADDPAARARLYHVHLPKLESAGLVDWNRRQRTVVRGPTFDDVVPLLEAIDAVGDATTGTDAREEESAGEE
jgi:hypothetical protein